MEKIHLLDLEYHELESFIRGMDAKPFRVKQIFSWLHKGIDSFDEMTNIPIQLKSRIMEIADIGGVKIQHKIKSNIDDTIKYLFLLEDNNIIEGVLMRYSHGNTLCISSQVGCKMGCSFCASTLEGLVRNLKAGEMLAQVLAVNRDISQGPGERAITNIVIMGSGEPLDNYDNTIKFLRILNHPNGIHISLRNVSLSTCGLVSKIRKLAVEGLPVTLSISLHGPNNDIRRQIMPIAKVYSIEEIINACKFYIEQTGRRVIFEYALVHNVNDKPTHAVELANLLRGMQCHVNLIPLNPVLERNLEGSYKEDMKHFKGILEDRHISVTQRREMGTDIEGACGQLRRKYLNKD